VADDLDRHLRERMTTDPAFAAAYRDRVGVLGATRDLIVSCIPVDYADGGTTLVEVWPGKDDGPSRHIYGDPRRVAETIAATLHAAGLLDDATRIDWEAVRAHRRTVALLADEEEGDDA
jgi:hypothetical protein